MNLLNNFFIRLTKSYNKSRYSRNRQSTRVMFYFSLYINIAVIYLIFYLFYGLSFSLLWFWWLGYYLFFIFNLNIFLRYKNIKV